jgi:hypothetical protein
MIDMLIARATRSMILHLSTRNLTTKRNPANTSPTQQTKSRTSSRAFADDLICLCTNIADLRAQANKLSLYSDWAAIIVSSEKKTKVTGLIHNADKYGNTYKGNLLQKQLKGNIVVQEQATQFIWLYEPFAYLRAHHEPKLETPTHPPDKISQGKAQGPKRILLLIKATP